MEKYVVLNGEEIRYLEPGEDKWLKEKCRAGPRHCRAEKRNMLESSIEYRNYTIGDVVCAGIWILRRRHIAYVGSYKK